MPALVGNRRTAAKALAVWQANMDALDLDEHDLPVDGWRYIGSGCFREVWLHIASNVVYKIEIDHDDDYGNRNEWKQAKRLRKIVWEHVYIPKTSLFTIDGYDIIGMEYIDGKLGVNTPGAGYKSKGYKEFAAKGQLDDMHAANFKINSMGKMCPVDMAAECNA